MIIGKPMCWSKDIWDEVNETWYVEYYCKKMDWCVVKQKDQRAPDCFGECEDKK